MKDQPFAPALAHELGDVPHVSGLLRRIAQLSGAGERVTDWLTKVAVTRGASHYRRDSDPTMPADLPAISDEEIGGAWNLPSRLPVGEASSALSGEWRLDKELYAFYWGFRAVFSWLLKPGKIALLD